VILSRRSGYPNLHNKEKWLSQPAFREHREIIRNHDEENDEEGAISLWL
jgi:hypothetical protein